MCPNPAGDVLTAAVRMEDPSRALRLVSAESVQSVTFGAFVERIESTHIARLLARQGCDVVARYGLLTVTAYIANDERKFEPDFYRDLEALELQLCDREPYVGSARMWQLVARRC